MALAGFYIFERGTVDQEDVHPAVVVVVEDGDAAAHGLHDIELLRAAAGEVEVDAGGAGYVGEGDVERRQGLVRTLGWCRLRGGVLGERETLDREREHEIQAPPREDLLRHHWTGPDAMPPVTGCAFLRVAKVSSSCLASSFRPAFSKARDS